MDESMNKLKLWLQYDAWSYIGENNSLKQWPFIIREGVLARKGKQVVFIASGGVYAINGRARMNKKYIDFIESGIWKNDSEGE